MRLGSAVQITVGDADVTGVTFTQSGFVLSVVSDLEQDVQATSGDTTRECAPRPGTRVAMRWAHSVSLPRSPRRTFSHPRRVRTTVNLHVAAGTTRMCVTQPGVYSITADKCFKFKEPKSSFSFDTSAPKPVQMHASKYRVGGMITLSAEDAAAAPDASQLAVQVALTVDGRKKKVRPQRPSAVTTRLVSPPRPVPTMCLCCTAAPRHCHAPRRPCVHVLHLRPCWRCRHGDSGLRRR